MKLSKKRVIILVSSVILLVLIGALFVAYEGGPYDKNNGKDIVVDIPMGSTVSSVADILKENNLIKNEVLFKLNFKMKNNASHMKSGKYLLSQKLSNSDIIEKLVSGEIYRDGIKVTIPEGSTSNEIIALLVKNELGKKEDFDGSFPEYRRSGRQQAARSGHIIYTFSGRCADLIRCFWQYGRVGGASRYAEGDQGREFVDGGWFPHDVEQSRH